MGRVNTTVSHAPFIADPTSISRLGGGRQIDWANVPDRYRIGAVVVTLTANAAQGATSLTVTALNGAIPNGTLLDFGGTKTARLTTAAVAGATTVAVAATPTAMVTGDLATYLGLMPGKKFLPAGTAIGEILNATGLVSPRIVTTNPAAGLLETNAREDEQFAPITGYGIIAGGVIYENLLPDATGSPKTLPSAIKTELAANSTGFRFESYGDSRST